MYADVFYITISIRVGVMKSIDKLRRSMLSITGCANTRTRDYRIEQILVFPGYATVLTLEYKSP